MRLQSIRITILAVCAMVVTHQAAAQRASELRRGISLPTSPVAMTAEQSLRRTPAKTYWKEGAMIGAIPNSLVAFFVFKDWGDSTTDGVLAGIVAGGVTGIIGALIGGQFQKGGG